MIFQTVNLQPAFQFLQPKLLGNSKTLLLQNGHSPMTLDGYFFAFFPTGDAELACATIAACFHSVAQSATNFLIANINALGSPDPCAICDRSSSHLAVSSGLAKTLEIGIFFNVSTNAIPFGSACKFFSLRVTYLRESSVSII